MKNRLLIIISTLIPVIGIIIGLSFFSMTSSDHHNVSENDKYCTTELIVKTTTYMGDIFGRKLVEQIVREEIAKFGAIYDIPERKVIITDLGENNLQISLHGYWSLKSDKPNLVDALIRLNSIDNIVENGGKSLVVMCQ